ncbi:MAG: glycosidase, partial [Chloroflexi bacterium]
QGIALLDRDDPTRVIARQSEPILEPELNWEVNGFVPNVVFSCGQVILGDQLYVYYAGADTAIGVAAVPLEEINSFGV